MVETPVEGTTAMVGTPIIAETIKTLGNQGTQTAAIKSPISRGNRSINFNRYGTLATAEMLAAVGHQKQQQIAANFDS